MKKILVIAYVFPPIAYAGTFRTLRLVKYLARMDYDITVLTLKEQPDLFNDPSLLNRIDRPVRIIRTPTIDFWRSYQKIKQKVLDLPLGRLLNKIFSILIYPFCQPDHMVLWVPFATFKGYRLLRKEKFDVIYTSSPPHSEQITGWLLKRLMRVKWIADLRDPILDDLDAGEWNYLERKIHTWLEQRIFRNADGIVANTKVAREKMQQRYPGILVTTIHNSFDEEDFNQISLDKFRKFTIAHVGSIYNTRKTDLIFSAIKKLDEENKIAPENFQMLFVGLNNPRLQQEIKDYGLDQYVEIQEITTHEKALRIMKKSHLVLLIKGLGENSSGQIPGKLFEYLASENPILCIAPLESEAAEIIKETAAGEVFQENDASIKEFMEEYLSFYRKDSQKKAFIPNQNRLNYSSHSMAKKFDKLLSEIN
jgi:glycosyltransferase involved in cell wall biosynthesis